jgi:hypothetical protein
VYEKIPDGKEGELSPLLLSPEKQRADASTADSPPFIVANSMREVQPEINLLVTPKKENLMSWELQNEPGWMLAPAKVGKADD